jgi:hypothetical protein
LQEGRIWLDWFIVKDMYKNYFVATKGFLDPKDRLYEFYAFPEKYLGLIALISQTSYQRKIWDEQLRHLNF